MSLVPGVKDIDMHNPVINNLIQSSLPNEYGKKLEWIPCSQITDIESTQIDNVHYTRRYNDEIMLLCLGNSGECTQTFVSEFARIYSLPTHEDNDVIQFERYPHWLEHR